MFVVMIRETYNYLFVELSAPLSREWPLISSPFPLMLIIFGYLYFVLYAGPRYMKDRPPYKLKTFILLYDLIQILANLWMVQEHISFGWFSKYGIICSEPPPDFPKTLKMFSSIWCLLLLKIFDLIETCLFVLRKKQNQVSNLHVYHHVSNIFFAWLYLKYILDERATLFSLINCAVHVIMYMYYFISAMGPKCQQIISPLKPFITKIQMNGFQFLSLRNTNLNCCALKAQEEDDDLKKLQESVCQKQSSKFVERGELLFQEQNGNVYLMLPKKMQDQIIEKVHERAYFLIAKTEDLMKANYWIPDLRSTIGKIQFLAIIICILQILNPACPVQTKFHSVAAVIFIGNLLIFLYLFNDFYKKSYTNVSKERNS